MNVASMSALLAAATDASSVPSGVLVVLMGMGIVFVGLICIVVLCYLMSQVVKFLEKMSGSESAPAASMATPAAVSSPVATVQSPVENRQELVAAISAALAEELGTDVSGIRILSLKKV